MNDVISTCVLSQQSRAELRNESQKEKYRPNLPCHITEKLKEIRNKYYHTRQRGISSEETRALLFNRHMKIRTKCFGRNCLEFINHGHYHFINY
jgi:hypothetical protein